MAGKLDGFVAVHCGAGHHPLETRAPIQRTCKEACLKAYDILRNHDDESSLIDACVAATMVLEDDPLTNAGVGSNLTLEERVECDAGLMEGGHLRFAGIGCLSNVKNPILSCQKLLDLQEKGSNSLVPPALLAGDGALQFSRKCGLQMASDADMATARSLAGYRKALKTVSAERSNRRDRLDTVGVVVVNNRGQVAASCSSGGLLLKLPGRIGHSANFGCGVWAQQQAPPVEGCNTSVAVSCTGCGEYITRTSLAKTISQRIFSCSEDAFINTAHVLGNTLREDFLDSYLLKGMEEGRKIAGAIALKTDAISKEELMIDFAYGHCCPSSTMCLAYTVAGKDKPKIRLVTSECGENSKVVAAGEVIRMKMKEDK